ncbi:MAG: phosphotransferase [Chloroflexia bacterium]|nr:phosphotransferase [Chloroflexia bacterium]
MKTQPKDLESKAIALALSEHWNIECSSLCYAPLGFGSHHWVADTIDGQKWFVTVDGLQAHYSGDSADASFNTLTSAFQMAVLLRDVANLPFVIAPLVDASGRAIVRLSDHFAIAVFPYLDVESSEFGEFRNQSDRLEAMVRIGEVHNATSDISVTSLRRNTLAIPNRAGLLVALGSIDTAWSAGPYSEPARQLLRQHASTLLKRLDDFDDLAKSVMGSRSGWVISHGEPHAGNVIRTRTGELVVVDWDTVAYAPRERDLWMMVNESNSDWSIYRDVTGIESLSTPAMAAYRIYWDLSEIAIYVSWCLKPHERTDEMEIAWTRLQEYVAFNPSH